MSAISERGAKLRIQTSAIGPAAAKASVRAGVFLAALGVAAPAACALEATEQVGKVFRLFGLGSNPAPQRAPGNPDAIVADCPQVFVDPGAGDLRSPPGADGASVRYQISIAQIARECSAQNEQIIINLGIEGAVVLGPLGQPGAYSGGLRVALRRSKDDAIVSSKIYRVGATVPPSSVRAEFRMVAEPMIAPVGSFRPADEYEILVGFTGEGGSEGAAHKSHKRGAR